MTVEFDDDAVVMDQSGHDRIGIELEILRLELVAA